MSEAEAPKPELKPIDDIFAEIKAATDKLGTTMTDEVATKVFESARLAGMERHLVIDCAAMIVAAIQRADYMAAVEAAAPKPIPFSEVRIKINSPLNELQSVQFGGPDGIDVTVMNP